MKTTPPDDRTREGERLQLAAFWLFERHRRASLRLARRAFLLALASQGEATADDVAAAVTIPAGIDPRLLGCVPSDFARQGIVERIGFEKSRRRTRHASIVSVWRLANRAAAELWLRLNPPIELEATPPAPPAATPTNDERPTAPTVDRSTSASNETRI
jgi:hypothetical protein